MNKKSIFSALGIAIYMVLTFIDRIIIQIPDLIYIIIGIIAIILIIIGIIKVVRKGSL